MKAKGKLIGLLTALLCIVPMMTGLFGLGDSASAAEPSTVDVTLHKKKMDDFPTGGINNTGEIMPEIENKYEPLEGVEFKPWDVTKDFYRLLQAEGITGNETKEVYDKKVKEIMSTVTADEFGDKEDAGAAKLTGSNGEVTFENLKDKGTDGVYKVYWFQETKNPETHYDQLVLLTLPVMKADKVTENTDIHLYPKNKLENKPTKELVDAPVPPGDRVSYDVGKQIQYKVKYMIPNQIGDILKNEDGTDKQTRYRQLIFKDNVTQDGVRFVGIDSITIGTGVNKDVKELLIDPSSIFAKTTYENKNPDYHATGKRAGFEIKMNLNDKTAAGSLPEFSRSKTTAEWLGNYAGQTMELIYTVELTKDTPVDKDINNSFSVDLQQSNELDVEVVTPDDPPPAITTGGKKFVKYETGKETQTLKGAEFVITKEENSKTWYLTGNADKYGWKEVETDYPDAFKIKSEADDGYFEIKGLKYGQYKLVETKAPNGYQIGGPVSFEISKDSYSIADDTLREGVPNASRGGFLPSTGGMGIVIFLLIGGALMAFAVTRYRKTQHTA